MSCCASHPPPKRVKVPRSLSLQAQPAAPGGGSEGGDELAKVVDQIDVQQVGKTDGAVLHPWVADGLTEEEVVGRPVRSCSKNGVWGAVAVVESFGSGSSAGHARTTGTGDSRAAPLGQLQLYGRTGRDARQCVVMDCSPAGRPWRWSFDLAWPRLRGGDELMEDPDALEATPELAAHVERLRRSCAELPTRPPSLQLDNRNMLRFLRARDFDHGAALKLWKKNVQWREGTLDPERSFGTPWVDSTFASRWAATEGGLFELQCNFPHLVCRDRAGRPVGIYCGGLFNWRTSYCTEQELLLHNGVWQEEMVHAIKMADAGADHPVVDQVTVIDLKGLRLSGLTRFMWCKCSGHLISSHCVAHCHRPVLVFPPPSVSRPNKVTVARTAWLPKMIGVGCDFYPENLNMMLVVNAPSFLAFAYNLVGAMVNKRTRRKVRVVTSETTTAELLRVIHPSQLPEWLGGQRNTPLDTLLPAIERQVAQHGAASNHRCRNIREAGGAWGSWDGHWMVDRSLWWPEHAASRGGRQSAEEEEEMTAGAGDEGSGLAAGRATTAVPASTGTAVAAERILAPGRTVKVAGSHKASSGCCRTPQLLTLENLFISVFMAIAVSITCAHHTPRVT